MKISRINLATALLIIGIIGPGIITASVDNDAGGITTYTLIGARFGYSMLWALIPVTALLIIVQEMCARMGAVTGKGLADLIRENFGVRWTLVIMIGLVLGNLFVTVAEFAGIAAVGEIIGVSRYLLIPLITLLILVSTIKLNYKTMEKFFFILTFFYISYIISGVLSKPHWGS
ncbi:TPA: divalent metal cation transporter, partial [Candidatus Woesearchaeota archaeon]|nr:divalent metal cation transporter [Candidatus Woesearchaeota archaeon]